MSPLKHPYIQLFLFSLVDCLTLEVSSNSMTMKIIIFCCKFSAGTDTSSSSRIQPATFQLQDALKPLQATFSVNRIHSRSTSLQHYHTVPDSSSHMNQSTCPGGFKQADRMRSFSVKRKRKAPTRQIINQCCVPGTCLGTKTD